MTISTTFKKVLTVGVTLAALALVACGSDDKASDNKSADRSNESSESASNSASSSDNEAVEVPGAPAGFTATPANTRLKFGEEANVVTRNSQDENQFWTLKVTGLREIPKEDFPDITDDPDLKSFACLDYEMVYQGSVDLQDPEALHTATAPTLTVTGEGGGMANSFYGGGDEQVCGPHESEAAPDDLRKLEEGKTYKGSELAFFSKGGGLEPTGGKFKSEVKDIPGLPEDATVYWEE